MCNAPLLDWTFESLALAGVQEIFVICRSHAEQVKAAIRCVHSLVPLHPDTLNHVVHVENQSGLAPAQASK